MSNNGEDGGENSCCHGGRTVDADSMLALVFFLLSTAYCGRVVHLKGPVFAFVFAGNQARNVAISNSEAHTTDRNMIASGRVRREMKWRAVSIRLAGSRVASLGNFIVVSEAIGHCGLDHVVRRAGDGDLVALCSAKGGDECGENELHGGR